MPPALKAYVESPQMEKWSTEYLKNYRDTLAHRIPLYIPPATYSEADELRSRAIDEEWLDHVHRGDFDRAEALFAEQQGLGVACPMFVHSFSEEDRGRPLVLHPQMLSDAKTVIEACTLFFAHWHVREEDRGD